VRVARIAYQLAQSRLPKYTHVKSPHRFTFPQLAACVLMAFYLDMSYRDMEEWLLATDQVRAVLELKEVPDHSTLSRAAKRLKVVDLTRMRDELLGQAGVEEDVVVADGTGFTPRQASSYYVNRTGKPIQEFIKGLYVMGLRTRFIVGWGSTRRRGIDSPHLPGLRRQAAVYGRHSHGRTAWVMVADMGFDGPATRPLPLIGITVGSGLLSKTNGAALRVRSTYPASVELAGGAPILIPLRVDDQALRAIYERLDGVLVSGGGDIEPAAYSAAASPLTVEVDPDRDHIETQLVRWAVEDDKPLLGICRGSQLINVALGGSLIQDIASEVDTSIRHDGPDDGWFIRHAHDVQVARGSRLFDALGLTEERLPVNSMHHQAVKDIAAPLCVVARAPDGVIEGLEHPDRRFIMAVQWHPEALAGRELPQRRLFEAFVRAASR